MLDTFGRDINYLRVSLTDRCNLRCRYCMPEEGIDNIGHIRVLTLEQIYRVIKAAARVGFRKVRLTGGEPLVRKNITNLIADISSLPEIDDISLTTNGILFAQMADDLKNAGLTRVNISLDSLVPQKFKYITRKGELADVKKSIGKALDMGMDPVKINVVTMKGFNDNEILDFAELAYNNPLHIRFIEFMPVGNLAFQTRDKVINIDQIKKIIMQQYNLSPENNIQGSGPAKYYTLKGGQGSVGFISPISNHFCSECNRIRLTADGKLRGCLYHSSEIDLRLALQKGCSDNYLETMIKKCVVLKPGRHQMQDGWGSDNPRKMYQIGG